MLSLHVKTNELKSKRKVLKISYIKGKYLGSRYLPLVFCAYTSSIFMTYLLAFPDLHGDVHVWPIAFNIVGIKHFFVSAFQNMAFAAYLAVVQTFPCIQNILQAFFSCWWFNIWCCHIGFLLLVESLLWDWATKWCPGFCHVINFTYLSVAKRKRAKLWYDMAKPWEIFCCPGYYKKS